MGATVDALHRLQEVELQLAELKRKIARKHRAVQRQEGRISEIEREIETRRAELTRTRVDADRLDVDMRAHDESIAKLRQSLNLVKTNKEYSAILTQLNTEKADNSKVEERAMELLNRIDAKRTEISETEERLKQELARLGTLKTTAAETEAKARGRIEELTAQRDGAADAVPAQALELFNRVAGKNEGEALAKVVRTHPKRSEYACDGCNMSITIEQVNAIMSRDQAVVCNTCGRILYVESQPTPHR